MLCHTHQRAALVYRSVDRLVQEELRKSIHQAHAAGLGTCPWCGCDKVSRLGPKARYEFQCQSCVRKRGLRLRYFRQDKYAEAWRMIDSGCSDAEIVKETGLRRPTVIRVRATVRRKRGSGSKSRSRGPAL